MNQPRISIIIPVYNVEPYIAECLQSVMRQNYVGPIECIVVDDCGTDRSMNIANRMITGYNGPIEFKVLHHKSNTGISAARNTGLEAAQCDYVFFMDSDDTLSVDCIDYLVSLSFDREYDMIVGDCDRDCDTNTSDLDVFYDKYHNRVIGKEFSDVKEISGREFLLEWIRAFSSSISAWNKLYSMRYLRDSKVLYRSISFSEDVLFNFELFSRSSTICLSNKITYHYRKREGSIINDASRNQLDFRNKLVDLWLELSHVNVEDGFDDLKENYLHRYGIRIFARSKWNNLRFYRVFCLLHKEYPYFPLRLWMQKEKNLHWYKSRLLWSLPTFLGYIWFQVKWWKNHVCQNKEYEKE